MGVIVVTGVCVILPIVIVWLSTRAKSVAVNRRFDLLHAAIEKGVDIDPNLLLDPKKEKASIKMQLLNKLQWGIIFLLAGIIVGVYAILNSHIAELVWLAGVAVAVGAALTAIYFFGKRDLKPEIEAEEPHK